LFGCFRARLLWPELAAVDTAWRLETLPGLAPATIDGKQVLVASGDA
jgi:hypothetical protein